MVEGVDSSSRPDLSNYFNNSKLCFVEGRRGGKGREGKGWEGKEREGKGREGKGRKELKGR
jgi:hypothetical protein